MSPKRLLLIPLLLTLLFHTAPASEWDVTGYGLLKNRELERILDVFSTGESEEVIFDTGTIDNLMLITHDTVISDGYLHSEYTVQATDPQGNQRTVYWDGNGWLDFPTNFVAQSLSVHIEPGMRYAYGNIYFDGISTEEADDLRSFFVPNNYLFDFKRFRIYSPKALNSAVNNLTEYFRQSGYREASVEVVDRSYNHDKGLVHLTVAIRKGPLHRIENIREKWSVIPADSPVEPTSRTLHDQDFSRRWIREQMRQSLNRLHTAGFPDATAEIEITELSRETNAVSWDVTILLNPGPRVRLGDIKYDGDERTRRSVLNRQVKLDTGDWLDILEIERARFRLSRLGLYQRIETEFDPPPGSDESDRNLTFQVQPDKRLRVSLLFGYGSYERLRGGIEIERNNLWGRAHRERLRLSQSFKSSTAAYTYTMPEIFGEDVSVSMETHYLKREELSFDRTEYGVELRFSKPLGSRSTASAGYRLERLGADVALLQNGVPELTETNVGSVFLGYRRDLRNNPIYPTAGYQFRTEWEGSDPNLGGKGSYQRIQLFASWHKEWKKGRMVHVRFSHGAAAAFINGEKEIPLNRRYFPGGSDSIRGYRQGGAGPRDASGNYTGAETFSLLQLEFEQAIGPNLSGVIFTDQLLYAEDASDWPGSDYLYSIGLGIRYRTIVGPLRLEGAYNPNRNPGDPKYSIHLSLGIPF